MPVSVAIGFALLLVAGVAVPAVPRVGPVINLVSACPGTAPCRSNPQFGILGEKAYVVGRTVFLEGISNDRFFDKMIQWVYLGDAHRLAEVADLALLRDAADREIQVKARLLGMPIQKSRLRSQSEASSGRRKGGRDRQLQVYLGGLRIRVRASRARVPAYRKARIDGLGFQARDLNTKTSR
jgi:hypothetical protein